MYMDIHLIICIHIKRDLYVYRWIHIYLYKESWFCFFSSSISLENPDWCIIQGTLSQRPCPWPQSLSNGAAVVAGLARPHPGAGLHLTFNPPLCKQTTSQPLNKHFWAFNFHYFLGKGRLNSSVSVCISVRDDGKEMRRNSLASQISKVLGAAALYEEL